MILYFNCAVELWEWRGSPTDRHHGHHTAVCRERHPVDPVHRSCLPWQECPGTAGSRTSHWKSMYRGISVVPEGFKKKKFHISQNNILLILDLMVLIVGEEIGGGLFHPRVRQTRVLVLLWTKVFYLEIIGFGDKKLVKWIVDIKCCMLEVVFQGWGTHVPLLKKLIHVYFGVIHMLEAHLDNPPPLFFRG